jgi:hypothetical protein
MIKHIHQCPVCLSEDTHPRNGGYQFEHERRCSVCGAVFDPSMPKAVWNLIDAIHERAAKKVEATPRDAEKQGE